MTLFTTLARKGSAMSSKDIFHITPQHFSAMNIQFYGEASPLEQHDNFFDSAWVGYAIMITVTIFLSCMSVLIPHAFFFATLDETNSAFLSILSSIAVLTPLTLSIINCHQISIKNFGIHRYLIPITAISSAFFFFTHLI